MLTGIFVVPAFIFIASLLLRPPGRYGQAQFKGNAMFELNVAVFPELVEGFTLSLSKGRNPFISKPFCSLGFAAKSAKTNMRFKVKITNGSTRSGI